MKRVFIYYLFLKRSGACDPGQPITKNLNEIRCNKFRGSRYHRQIDHVRWSNFPFVNFADTGIDKLIDDDHCMLYIVTGIE